ncbi:hypothetical protein PUR45_25250, partial [Klebsiella pneumoniae]|nr:hypothetical protein [Klebsiella pneumoniae]
RYIDKHGKPLALYSDKAGVFRVNNKHATGGDGHTQFGRAITIQVRITKIMLNIKINNIKINMLRR